LKEAAECLMVSDVGQVGGVGNSCQTVVLFDWSLEWVLERIVSAGPFGSLSVSNEGCPFNARRVHGGTSPLSLLVAAMSPALLRLCGGT
jgi:hypothetical protein